ncbi:MAG: site-specific integrase [Desulfonauticus sp.]|nr:site-specific integrase [Desulfonauticus sp.]
MIYPLVVTALTTGMRAGEIFNLRVQDLNFREGIIHIRDSKSGENGVAYMSEHLKEILKELAKGKKPYEHVFKKPNGKTFDAAPDVWKTIIRDLGFNKDITDTREKVVFHTLRHTFCSWLPWQEFPSTSSKNLPVTRQFR